MVTEVDDPEEIFQRTNDKVSWHLLLSIYLPIDFCYCFACTLPCILPFLVFHHYLFFAIPCNSPYFAFASSPNLARKMSKQFKANKSTPTTRAQHKRQAQEKPIEDDPLGLKALFEISPLKCLAPLSITTNAISLTPCKNSQMDIFSLFARFADVAPSIQDNRPGGHVKVIELGLLIVQGDEEKVGGGLRGEEGEAASCWHHWAKVVDASACFLTQFTSTFWSKEVNANAVYTVTKLSIGAAREMIVGNGRQDWGGGFCAPALDSLAVMINAVERQNTKSIATLRELGANSGLHTI
uniref:Uncharacterized protein n=1 Tax=Plectus sambesii TaxID=2011161 RepID=A0A914VP00_9BILA